MKPKAAEEEPAGTRSKQKQQEEIGGNGCGAATCGRRTSCRQKQSEEIGGNRCGAATCKSNGRQPPCSLKVRKEDHQEAQATGDNGYGAERRGKITNSRVC